MFNPFISNVHFSKEHLSCFSAFLFFCFFNIIVSCKRPYGSFRNSIFIKRVDSHIYRFAFDQRANILLPDRMLTVVCLMSVGDTDFSPPSTAVNFLICNSSHHLSAGESLPLFVESSLYGNILRISSVCMF